MLFRMLEERIAEVAAEVMPDRMHMVYATGAVELDREAIAHDPEVVPLRGIVAAHPREHHRIDACGTPPRDLGLLERRGQARRERTHE